MNRPSKHQIIGIVFAIVSIFLYVLSDTLIKYFLITNYSVEQATFLRAVVKIIYLLVPLIFYYKSLAPLKTHKPFIHFLNAICGSARSYAYMSAIVLIPFAEVSALSYVSVIFFVIISWFLFKEPINKFHIIGIVIGFIGIIVALKPGFAMFKLGAIVSLLAAFIAALNKVTIKKLSISDHPMSIVVYPNLFLIIVSLPVLSKLWVSVSLKDWALFFSIGLIATIAQYLTVLSLKFTTAPTIAPYNYTYFGWFVLMDYLFGGIVPNIMVVIGAGFIILSNVIILFALRRKSES
ncbi:MAG: DMT family transporter [Sphingobacteriia bacterium]|nr:DMT family transporter [Sphingobacteriia bacterium]